MAGFSSNGRGEVGQGGMHEGVGMGVNGGGEGESEMRSIDGWFFK